MRNCQSESLLFTTDGQLLTVFNKGRIHLRSAQSIQQTILSATRLWSSEILHLPTSLLLTSNHAPHPHKVTRSLFGPNQRRCMLAYRNSHNSNGLRNGCNTNKSMFVCVHTRLGGNPPAYIMLRSEQQTSTSVQLVV